MVSQAIEDNSIMLDLLCPTPVKQENNLLDGQGTRCISGCSPRSRHHVDGLETLDRSESVDRDSTRL